MCCSSKIIKNCLLYTSKNNPMVGDIIDIDIPTKSFGRIAAQTAKQVIIQGIREAERGMVISEFERDVYKRQERRRLLYCVCKHASVCNYGGYNSMARIAGVDLPREKRVEIEMCIRDRKSGGQTDKSEPD